MARKAWPSKTAVVATEGDPGGKERILVVDDQDDVRLTFCQFLERAGYQVTSVADGKLALNQIARGDHDVVVLDLALPDVSGLEILRGIKPRASVEVICVTGSDADGLEEQVLQLGASEFLRKPVGYEVLTDAVERAQQRVRKQRHDRHRIVAYIDSHFASLHSTQEVASRWSVSTKTVERHVAHERDMRFRAYLVRLRIGRAKEFLRSTDMSMKEIAAAVGFPTQQNPSTTFRRLVGCAPTTFRRQNQRG